MNPLDKLIAAIRSARMEDVKTLLQQVDINAVAPESGYTPLTAAAMYNVPEAVDLLLEKGAWADKKDKTGCTPLIAAAAGSAKTGIVRVLLEHSASVHEKTNRGSTALMAAAVNGASDTVSLLVEKGGEAIDEKNYAGETALLLAVQGLFSYRKDDHIETVRCLMAAGADAGIRDNNGFTPWDLAVERDYPEIVAIIDQGLEDRRGQAEAAIRAEEADKEKGRRDRTLEKQAYLQKHAPRLNLGRGARP